MGLLRQIVAVALTVVLLATVAVVSPFGGLRSAAADTPVVSRADAAVAIYRLAGSPAGPFPDSGFGDVVAGSAAATAIDWLAATGVTVGRADGTFGPDAMLTRAAQATMLYRLAGSPAGPFPAAGFSDVAPSAVHAGAIDWMAATGITDGRSDGTFGARRAVTMSQMITFTVRFQASPDVTVNVHDVATRTPAPAPATVPSVPQNLTVTASPERFELAWEEPASDGGAAITGYLVTITPEAGIAGIVTVAGTTATITGLTNGTEYTVSVVATNSAGNSPEATKTDTPPSPTVPSVPQNLTVTPSPERFELAWDAPASDGGAAITGYLVTITPEAGTAGIVTVAGTTVTITGLTNGTEYTVSVVATNSAGNSPEATKTDTIEFYLAANGVTIVCDDAALNATGMVNGTIFTKRDRNGVIADRASAATTCTSGITDMSYLFLNMSSFNEDITSWDTSSVTTMSGMFIRAAAFNQDLGFWDTSTVTTMQDMFFSATAFNQDIGHWDTSSVTNVAFAFSGAAAFNQDIGAWNTAKMTNMSSMFEGASTFNQNLSGWCVTLIGSAPNRFDLGATAWDKPARQPVWGTCPS